MTANSREWLARIKAVESEYLAIRLATDRLVEQASLNPSILGKVLRLGDLRQAAARLEDTYIVCLFSEFETGLRRYWARSRTTEPPNRTRDLVDGLAASLRVPFEVLNETHAVRELRNHLVHARDGPTAPIILAQARHYLCAFFSYLPPFW